MLPETIGTNIQSIEFVLEIQLVAVRLLRRSWLVLRVRNATTKYKVEAKR